MRIVISIIVAGLTFHLNAQDTLALTFEQAIKIGLENNVTLNQQKNLLELNQTQKTSAVLAFGPTVNARVSATQFNGNSFNQQQGRVINGIRDNVSGSLFANMTLFNGMGRVSTLKAAENQLNAQSYFVKRSSEDVINTVASQYLQVLLDMELLRIAKQNYEAQARQLEQVKAQVELGARPIVDELNQEAQTNNTELRMLQAEIALNNDKAALTATLLIDPFQPIKVLKPNWDLNELLNDTRDHQALYDLAKTNRGDLLRAINQEKAAQYNYKASQANMLPSLNAFFSYGSSYNYAYGIPDSVLAQDPSINRRFSKQFGADNIFKSYGLELNIPIFNGMQNRAAAYQQKTAYRNASLTKSNVEIAVKTDVIRTQSNFQVQKKTYVVSQSQLRAAAQAFELERERYNLGVTNFVEYVRANQAFVQAQTDLAQAEFRLLFQKVLMEYATGTLKTEVGNP